MNIEFLLLITAGIVFILVGRVLVFLMGKAVAFINSYSEIKDSEQVPNEKVAPNNPRYLWYERPTKTPSYFSYQDELDRMVFRKPDEIPTNKEIDEVMDGLAKKFYGDK
jgi:hypothetical protein